ncbi:MAG: DUF6655 family protein [Pirellulales bacterium]
MSSLDVATRWSPHLKSARPGAFGAALLALVMFAGCGTTKWSDTPRTATEQLLISDAIDRAISQIDFGPLKGEKIFLDTQYLNTTIDKDYLISTLRQHMLASQLTLCTKKEDAAYVVEARSGAVGTSRHDLLYGVPATNLPSISPMPGAPSQIPEIPFAKRTDQMGVAKLAVFAYDNQTGERVWQSGMTRVVSNAKDLWVLGAGPFQRGTIYSGDDDVMKVPLAFGRPRFRKKNDAPVRVVRNENFRSGGQLAKKDKEKAEEPVLTAQAPPAAATPTSATPPAAPPAPPPATPAQTQPLPPVEGAGPGSAAPQFNQLQIPGPPLPSGREGEVLRR